MTGRPRSPGGQTEAAGSPAPGPPRRPNGVPGLAGKWLRPDRAGAADTVFCDVVSGRVFVFFDAARAPDGDPVVVSWDGGEATPLMGTPRQLGISLVPNGDFRDGLIGWSLEGPRRGVRAGIDLSPEWTLAGGHTAFVRGKGENGGPGTLAYVGGLGRGSMPVIGGQTYLLSVLIGTHRCEATISVRFLGPDGAVISRFTEDVAEGRRAGRDRADHHLVNQSIRAPDSAVRASLAFEKSVTEAGQRDSFLFISEVVFGRQGKRFPAVDRDPRRLDAVARWETPSYLSAPLPAALLDGAQHVLRVLASATGHELPESPLRVRRRRTFDGGIDEVAGPVVGGWVRDRSAPNAVTDVAIEVDGEEVARGRADRGRGSEGHGFRVVVPGTLLDEKPHTLLLRALPDGAIVDEAVHVLSRRAGAKGPTASAAQSSDETVATLARALARSEAARRQLEAHLTALDAEANPATGVDVHRASAPILGREAGTWLGTDRPRAAVVAWDVGHNPMGRAHVLYELLRETWDTAIVGPSWDRYGDGVWRPLRTFGIVSSWWRCRDLGDFLPLAMFHATRQRYDLVVVSKPRLPSLLLGLLIKEHSGCPLILDIDDEELAFVGGGEAIGIDELEREVQDLRLEPFGATGTRYAAGLIQHADAVTISNVALRRKYGGHMVRHARDEQTWHFDPSLRESSRRELGIGPDEFALVFLGTPREHKGILPVAKALHEMDDDGFSLHIVGDLPDRGLKAKLAKFDRARVRFHRGRDFSEVPAILAAADAVPLLQDPDHPIAAFQFPAKLSDATALGRPVLVTRVPPLEDLLFADGIWPVDDDDLAGTLQRLRASTTPGSAERIRHAFLAELSMSVNRARLHMAIDEAVEVRKPLPDELGRLKETLVREAGSLVQDRQATAEGQRRKPWVAPRAREPRTVDVALFWKQNDTGIYGRRPEMLVKYLLRSGRVGRVMYFDAPMRVDQLERHRVAATADTVEQDGPLLRNTLARWMGLLDDGPLMQRVYIHGGPKGGGLMGRDLPSLEDYPAFVGEQLTEAGFDPARTVALVCPVVWQFPDVQARFPFGRILVDLIDDQRAWPSNPEYRERLAASYLDTIGLADVLVSNCRPNAEAFAYPGKPVHVIPNGAEPILAASLPMPRPLARLQRPLIGYVGNMRDRINWSLLGDLAARRPDWTFVLAGPTDGRSEPRELAQRPNVVMPGVVEYRDLPAYLLNLDAAIVPHTRSPLTERMNPLKVYNYLSAGLPVVASGVSNMEDVEGLIVLAETTDEFEAALARIVEQPRAQGQRTDFVDVMSHLTWGSRAAELLELIDG